MSKDKVMILFPAEKELMRTLRELGDDKLREQILNSMIREGSKEIIERARQNVSSVKASSSWKASVSKAISYKKSKKRKNMPGKVVNGTVWPQNSKMNKKHRNTAHFFNSGTSRGIKAFNFMGKAYEQGLEPGLNRMDREANKILTRFAKRKGFKVISA
jgi:hypothetical protein